MATPQLINPIVPVVQIDAAFAHYSGSSTHDPGHLRTLFAAPADEDEDDPEEEEDDDLDEEEDEEDPDDYEDDDDEDEDEDDVVIEDDDEEEEPEDDVEEEEEDEDDDDTEAGESGFVKMWLGVSSLRRSRHSPGAGRR